MKNKKLGKTYQWLIGSWIVTAFMTLPALLCIHSMSSHVGFGLGSWSGSWITWLNVFICEHFQYLGFLGSLFGPALLMPLFITILINHRLAKNLLPK